MRALTLVYHDVVSGNAWDSSGFPGPAAAHYKVTWRDFERHIEAIAQSRRLSLGTAEDLLSGDSTTPRLILTFDDAGASARMIGDRLHARGWRAHFFVPTNLIGSPAFASEDDLSALGAMGHLVGSHSASHPERMAHCSDDDLLDEWTRSITRLSDIIGRPVVFASVPGGYSSKRVVHAAAAAGIRAVFDSEPVSRLRTVDGCLVIGRFSIRRGTTVHQLESLAAGHRAPRVRQYISWNTKKVAKAAGGSLYPKIRRALNRR